MTTEVNDNGNAPAPAPAPAPAATPAPAPAPAPAPTPVEVQPTADGKGFEPTGHAGLDLSLKFFSQHGITQDSPEIAEATKGNFEYLKAKLASLGDKAKGWEQYLAVAEAGHAELTKGASDKKEALTKEIHGYVGGEDNWKSIKEHTEANATPEELEQINTALKQGGFVAKAMAELLQRTHLQASGTTVEPASATVNQASVPTNGGALTLSGYRTELNALVQKVGANRLDGSPEYASLRAKYKGVTK